MFNKNYLFIAGIVVTAFYLALLLMVLSPPDELLAFVTSAPYNERGDFLAGVLGPMAFFWLIIGYFMQSSELSLQRQEISKQNEWRAYELELEKRQADPEFEVQLNGRQILVENVSTETARRLYVYYVSHDSRKLTIVGIASSLPPGERYDCTLDECMAPPIRDENNSEILLVYDTRLEDMRCQVWAYRYTSSEKDDIIGWQIGAAGQLPEYFLSYV